MPDMTTTPPEDLPPASSSAADRVVRAEAPAPQVAQPAVNPRDPDQITDRYQLEGMRRALAELRAAGNARPLRLTLPPEP